MKADPSMVVPANVSPAQQKMLDHLKTAGKNFDRTYKKDMVSSHAKTYALFQKYVASAKANPGLKSVIRGALPVVKMHLEMAKTLPDMKM